MNGAACSRFERSISAQRAGMLKLATCKRCECCGHFFGPHLLELHCIRDIQWERDTDPAVHILVLCLSCHASIHACSVPEREQRLLVRTRSKEITARMHRVFSPKLYTPPPSADPEDLFAAAFSPGGMDIFLNGA